MLKKKEVFILILIGLVIYLIYINNNANSKQKEQMMEFDYSEDNNISSMDENNISYIGENNISYIGENNISSMGDNNISSTGDNNISSTGENNISSMGQPQFPPMEDLPESILNILKEINNNPTPEQLKRLEIEVQNTMKDSNTTVLKIINDVKNAKKINGRADVEKKIYSLYMLMLMLYMSTNGEYFKEIGADVASSYGVMPSEKIMEKWELSGMPKIGSEGMSGKIGLPPLTKIPQSIKNIIIEIGDKQPTELQIRRLESAVKDAIPNPKLLVAEVRNAQKDNNGMPVLEEEKLQLYILMVMLFMVTKGESYKDEIGEDIKSYGAIPQK